MPLPRPLVSIIALCIAGGAATLLTGALYTKAPATVAVDTDRALDAEITRFVQQDSYKKTVTFAGIVAAKEDTRLAFEIPGTLISLDLRVGDTAEAGQIVARLDTRTLVANQQALDAHLKQAQAQVELANLQFERIQDLYGRGAVSQGQFDEARLGLESAEAAKTALQAELSAVNVALTKSELTLPFAATVNARHASIGDVVASGSPIYDITSKEGREAIIGIPAQIATQLVIDEVVTVYIDGQAIVGQILGISSKLDLRTRTQTVRIALVDDSLATPGQVAVLHHAITIETAGGWLPMTALTEGGRGLWTALVARTNQEGKIVTERAILEIIDFADDRVYVRGSLKNGDKVIASGTHRLVPGMAINPVEAAQ